MYTIQYIVGILNNKMIMIFSTLKQYLEICHSKNYIQICLLFVLEELIRASGYSGTLNTAPSVDDALS